MVIPSSRVYEQPKEEVSSVSNPEDQELAEVADENQLKGENTPQIQQFNTSASNIVV